MTALDQLAAASSAAIGPLQLTEIAIHDGLAEAAKFDNRTTWDNTAPTFDNRPTWDNWNKKR